MGDRGDKINKTWCLLSEMDLTFQAAGQDGYGCSLSRCWIEPTITSDERFPDVRTCIPSQVHPGLAPGSPAVSASTPIPALPLLLSLRVSSHLGGPLQGTATRRLPGRMSTGLSTPGVIILIWLRPGASRESFWPFPEAGEEEGGWESRLRLSVAIPGSAGTFALRGDSGGCRDWGRECLGGSPSVRAAKSHWGEERKGRDVELGRSTEKWDCRGWGRRGQG